MVNRCRRVWLDIPTLVQVSIGWHFRTGGTAVMFRVTVAVAYPGNVDWA